jgi:maltose alpha-D-glucosyltransferase/alpha-amylase
LEDRDGVRTPMQWDDGPNAGFSGASPEMLDDPVIEDPVYGYKQVNVRAQAAGPDSLLNWTRRVLRVRKQHPAFGRGHLRLLEPENRAILAYARQYRDETILLFHNLAPTPQETTLDLSDGGGKLVDLLSGKVLISAASTRFPVVLEPYGFRWFKLG